MPKIFLTMLLVVLSTLVGCKNDSILFSPSSLSIKTLVGINDGKGVKTTDRAGFLVFGPYVGISPGVYRLDIHGSLDGDAPVLGSFDVVSEKGGRIHTSFPIYRNMVSADGSVIARAYFEIQQKVDDAEFRIVVDAGAKGVFRGYALHRISDLPKD